MPAPSAEDHLQIFAAHKAERGTWESTWQQLRRYLDPIAPSFTGTDTPGAQNREFILDNSAESFGYMLAAALAGFLWNPASKWMALRARPYALNDDRDTAIWLAQATDIVLSMFEAPETRFYTQMGEVADDLVFFGTAGLWIADRPGKLPLFQHRPLSELVCAENADGFIDTVYRDIEWTARQAVQFFGEGKAGKHADKAYATPASREQKFRFLHCLYPRAEATDRSALPKDLPVASVWIAVESKETLRVSGAHEMPLPVARWRTRNGETYGRSPGMNALPDVKMLQRAQKATIRGAEKVIDPSLMVAHDGIMTPVRTGLNAINVVRTDYLLNARRPLIEPIVTGARPDLGEQFSERIRQRMAEAFLNHLIQLSRDPRMTATQVLKLDEQMLRVLGPVLGRLQSELLGPVVARTFGIAQRAGLLPPPPDALAGATVEVEYVSPIAKAQRLSEATSIVQFYEATAPMRATDPALEDNVDGDGAIRRVWDRMGAPLELLKDPRDVETRRKTRQEEAQAQADMVKLAHGAKAAQSATQAMAALKDNMPEAANAA